jgi:hypothetical protein
MQLVRTYPNLKKIFKISCSVAVVRVHIQNVERQNVERQNIERQNVERQNVDTSKRRHYKMSKFCSISSYIQD